MSKVTTIRSHIEDAPGAEIERMYPKCQDSGDGSRTPAWGKEEEDDDEFDNLHSDAQRNTAQDTGAGLGPRLGVGSHRTREKGRAKLG